MTDEQTAQPKEKKETLTLTPLTRKHIQIALETQKDVYARQYRKHQENAEIARVYQRLIDEITTIQRTLR